MILHLMARLFMDPLDDPFAAAEEMLNAWRLGANADAIVLDFMARHRARMATASSTGGSRSSSAPTRIFRQRTLKYSPAGQVT